MMFSPQPRVVQRQLPSTAGTTSESIADPDIDTCGAELASSFPVSGDQGSNSCIRVAARFRPVDMVEESLGAEKICVDFGDDGKSCCVTTTVASGTHETKDYTFVYDHVFQPGAKQEDVYLAMAKPVVDAIVNGINGTIFAYGQTGSGKTHTMLGPDGAKEFCRDIEVDMAEVGIIPRVLQDLLEHVDNSMGWMTLHALYVEIYQDRFQDLLVARNSENDGCFKPKTTELREATESPIFSLEDAMAVMRRGNKNRHTAGTKMNTNSSRSHAIFIVKVRKHGQQFAQLCLVDLAGSEKIKETGATGQQVKEAQKINESLLYLQQVVQALAENKKEASYRNCKLTWLLEKSLKDGAKTSILVAASPHEQNAQATLKALQFGQRASTIRAEVRRHVEDPEAVKRKLQEAEHELSLLRDDCRRLQAQKTAFEAVKMMPVASHGDSVEDQAEGGMLEMLTARRLYVWDFLPLLICPLTNAIMRDPVCAGDGHSYERWAIDRHMAKSKGFPLSPVTNQQMTTRQLVPNLMVRQLICHHIPELPPLEVSLPHFMRLHVWHVRLILTYLDARALARCEAAWPSFLAAANSSRVWNVLLSHDFGGSDVADGSGVTDNTCAAARTCYGKQILALKALEAQRMGTNSVVQGPLRGLVLQWKS